MPDALDISVSHCGSAATMVVVGELDAVTAPALDWRLRLVRASRASIVVLDLSRATFVDPAALQPVVDTSELLGERLRIIVGADALHAFALAGAGDAQFAGRLVPVRHEPRDRARGATASISGNAAGRPRPGAPANSRRRAADGPRHEASGADDLAVRDPPSLRSKRGLKARRAG